MSQYKILNGAPLSLSFNHVLMVITASGRAGEDEILTVNLDSEKQIQQEIIIP